MLSSRAFRAFQRRKLLEGAMDVDHVVAGGIHSGQMVAKGHGGDPVSAFCRAPVAGAVQKNQPDQVCGERIELLAIRRLDDALLFQ